MVLRVGRPTIELWNAQSGWPSTIAPLTSRNTRGRNGIAAH